MTRSCAWPTARHRAHSRRKRHRQGIGSRAIVAMSPPRGAAVHQRELRSSARHLIEAEVVWTREGAFTGQSLPVPGTSNRLIMALCFSTRSRRWIPTAEQLAACPGRTHRAAARQQKHQRRSTSAYHRPTTDLEEQVREGSFARPLYRVNVIPIFCPPAAEPTEISLCLSNISSASIAPQSASH